VEIVHFHRKSGQNSQSEFRKKTINYFIRVAEKCCDLMAAWTAQKAPLLQYVDELQAMIR
jgi:hypothetical protein